MQENRKHPRVVSSLRCWCEGPDVTFYARLYNLSEGGVFLRTRTPLPRGCTAKVRLGNEAGVEVEARVVWTRREEGPDGPSGMGLAFENVPDDAKERLRTIVDRETQSVSR